MIHLIRLLGRVELIIFERRPSIGMVSKALEKSMARAIVRLGGFLLLKPDAILCMIGSRAEVVDLSGRKPC